MSRPYYQPLPRVKAAEPPYIRLLQIQPSLFGTPLRVKFIVERLRKVMPKFSAISYTWDDQDPSRQIQVGQHTAYITQKLERALVVINQRYPGHLLWADGICINQDDQTEKASQVEFMNLIYGYAQQTLVWLGDPDITQQPWTCHLFSLLHNNLGHRILENAWRQNFLPALWREVRWFSRMWVVQEVGCNNNDDVKLLFGPDWELDWEDLLKAIPSISVGDREWTDANKVEGLLHIRDENAKRGSILFMMERFASFGCKEPRDRIAAMAGMQNPPPNAKPTALAIDYCCDDKEMFLRFAKHLVGLGFGLALLRLAAHKGPTKFSWPSWVPDWTKGSSQEPCLDIDDFYDYPATSVNGMMIIHCYQLEAYSNGYRATFKKPRRQNHGADFILKRNSSGYFRLAEWQQLQGNVRARSFNVDLVIV